MRTSHRGKKISWPGLEIENFIDFLQVFKQVFLADVDISYPELFMNRSWTVHEFMNPVKWIEAHSSWTMNRVKWTLFLWMVSSDFYKNQEICALIFIKINALLDFYKNQSWFHVWWASIVLLRERSTAVLVLRFAANYAQAAAARRRCCPPLAPADRHWAILSLPARGCAPTACMQGPALPAPRAFRAERRGTGVALALCWAWGWRGRRARRGGTEEARLSDRLIDDFYECVGNKNHTTRSSPHRNWFL